MNDVATPFYVVFLSEYLYPNTIQSSSSTSSSQTFEVNQQASWKPACRVQPDMQAQAGMDVLRDPFSSSISLSAQQYFELESDVFGCLSKLLDRVQDNYTFAQPGIQRMTFKMRELVQRIDSSLDAHLESQHVQYIHFAMRWMNCLLMRELVSATSYSEQVRPLCAVVLTDRVVVVFAVQPMVCIIRIWDAYLAEDSAATASTGVGSTLSNSGGSTGGSSGANSSSSGGSSSGANGHHAHSSSFSTLPSSSTVSASLPQDFYTGFRSFHIYVCCAFLLHFSANLKKLEFQELVLYLQKLPTENWGVKEVDTLLAQAWLYKS
jgi:hypothetical protein